MPSRGASTAYCAWVRPSGAMARSIEVRHRIDSRHTRPVIGRSCRSVTPERVHVHSSHVHHLRDESHIFDVRVPLSHDMTSGKGGGSAELQPGTHPARSHGSGR